VLRLAEHLDVPLRDRNLLLLAAGYAPVYTETRLDTPRLAMVLAAIRKILAGHDPYPALVVDGGWHLIEANAGVALLIEGVAEDLLVGSFNVLRLSLHPRGLAPRIINLAQWRKHVLDRLARQIHVTADPQLIDLHQELLGYSGDEDYGLDEDLVGPTDVAVPLRLRYSEDKQLSLFTTVTTFGTPTDVTVDELAIESFYPADEATAKFFHSQ
jgi:MmyB-like transcription regulator ligand binding domain